MGESPSSGASPLMAWFMLTGSHLSTISFNLCAHRHMIAWTRQLECLFVGGLVRADRQPLEHHFF